MVLLALAGVAASFALHEALIIRLEDRVREQLAQEVYELERLLEQRSQGDGSSELGSVFDRYFSGNVASEDEGIVAFLDGKVRRAELSSYPLRELPPELVREWQALSTSPTAGEEPRTGRYSTPLGTAHYAVLPVRAGTESGVFVVTQLPTSELQEITALQRTGFAITLAVVLIAGLLSWFAANRVLEPLRLLTDTARSISRFDLSRRVPVVGKGEGAEMARSFNAMLDRLGENFDSQRKFLREASHELRVPLTISIGQLDVLTADRRLEHRRAVELVIDELHRAADIVHELRVLAEAELPSFVNTEPVDIPSLSQELIEKASAIAPRKWVLREVGEGDVVADRHRLTEAVMNVVENAVRHTDENDTIALGTSSRNGEVRLYVQDEGPGVEVVDRDRIFQPFERGRHATRRYRGAGLGLAIVRAITDAHGGKVEFESEPGKGATFTIVVPREGVEPREAAAVAAEASA